MIITVAMIGLLALVAVEMVGSQSVGVKTAKLETDTTTINQVIGIYVAAGGDLSAVSTPQAVLDKLKKIRPQANWAQDSNVITGRLLDVRLRAKMMSGSMGTPRAVWVRSAKRFEIKTDASSGVADFILDDSLATVNYGVETLRNASALKYDPSNRSWIWAKGANTGITYVDPTTTNGIDATDYFDPTASPPTPPSTTGSGTGTATGTGTGTGTATGTGTGTATPPVQLPTPVINPLGGSFSYASFPTTVSISAAGGGIGGVLMYQKNGAGWQTYTGPITIAPTDIISAMNQSSNPAAYLDSAVASEQFYRLVDDFTGQVSGTFGNAAGGANLVTTTENTGNSATFKHGNTKLDLGNGQFLDAGTENVLTFTKANFNQITPNTWFSVGQMTMLNGTTFYSSEATGVTLSLDFQISNPSQNGVAHLNLNLISTDNSADRTASADIVEIQNPQTDFVVTIEGVEYRLELGWVNLDPSTGQAQGNQFLVYEGAQASAQIRARFVPNH